MIITCASIVSSY